MLDSGYVLGERIALLVEYYFYFHLIDLTVCVTSAAD